MLGTATGYRNSADSCLLGYKQRAVPHVAHKHLQSDLEHTVNQVEMLSYLHARSHDEKSSRSVDFMWGVSYSDVPTDLKS